MHHSNHYPPPDDDAFALEEGWAEFKQKAWMGRPNFVTGHKDNRLRVRYYHRPHDNALVGKAWFGPGTEGPPGHAHGGSMAALMDDVMGAASWVAGHLVLAANIKVSFRAKMPLGTVAQFEGWVEKVDGKKIHPRARLLGPDGKVYVEAEGLFIKIKMESFAALGNWNHPTAAVHAEAHS